MRYNTSMPVLPTLPTSRTRDLASCACGCGQMTQRTFTPGHDSRLKGLMIRVVRGVMTIEDVEAWGGKETAAAVTRGLKDKALMKRWNIAEETKVEKSA